MFGFNPAAYAHFLENNLRNPVKSIAENEKNGTTTSTCYGLPCQG